MKIDIVLNLYYQPPKALEDLIKHNTNLYIPINSGNLAVPVKSKFAKKFIHFEDEMKDNISHLNSKLNEMTSIYAYWKNLMKSPDYIGHNHYRRLFRIEDLNDVAEYDVIDAKPIPMLFNMSYFTGSQIPNFVPTDIKNGYAICHKIEDWNKMEALLKKTPYYVDFEDWSRQNSLTSPCNMFVMKKKIFEEYCEFIFPILFELEKQVDFTGYDNYQKRQLAFLSERMTSLFLYVKRQQGYKFKTVDTLFFEGWKTSEATDRRGQY